MTEERTVWAEGKPYMIVLSDEKEALLAAQAAGRAVVGVENQRERSGRPGEFLPARYVVEAPEDADERYLERVLRRHLGLPWIIAETERLVIREFTAEDAAHVWREDGDSDADRIFYTPERLEMYIRHQYGFYECGLWALADKESGRLVGKAGVIPDSCQMGGAGDAASAEETVFLELGYHIFTPYRGRGYAAEACRGIQAVLKAACGGPGRGPARLVVRARADSANTASIRVLETCGFAKKSSDMSEQIDFLWDIRYNE